MSDQLRARFEAFYQRRHGFTPMFEDGDYWGGETVKTAWAAFRDASQAPSEGADALHGYSEEFAAQKAHAYGTEIMRVWDVLKDAGRPADGKTRLADAVRAAIAASAGGKEQDHG